MVHPIQTVANLVYICDKTRNKTQPKTGRKTMKTKKQSKVKTSIVGEDYELENRRMKYGRFDDRSEFTKKK